MTPERSSRTTEPRTHSQPRMMARRSRPRHLDGSNLGEAPKSRLVVVGLPEHPARPNLIRHGSAAFLRRHRCNLPEYFDCRCCSPRLSFTVDHCSLPFLAAFVPGSALSRRVAIVPASLAANTHPADFLISGFYRRHSRPTQPGERPPWGCTGWCAWAALSTVQPCSTRCPGRRQRPLLCGDRHRPG